MSSRQRFGTWSIASLRALVMVGLLAAPVVGQQAQSAGDTAVRFRTHRVGNYRGEPCGVGDFNNDGKPDIVAGPYLYLAPDWTARTIRQIQGDVDEQGKGYRYDFMNLPLDVDGDGLLDVLSCSWHEKRSTWYRNPGSAQGLWQEHLIEENGNFECGDLWDIDGDGKAHEVLPHVQRTVWYEPARPASGSGGFAVHVVSERLITFGGGVGDVNGDGRPDIIRPEAWYQAPADPRKGQWKEHPLALGHIDPAQADHTPQILVYDVNGDGRNDLITSSAHKYGIFWYEQVPGEPIGWRRHVIDKSWSQAHSLQLADLDLDGDLDLATGKRFMAHNGGDPGAFEPLCVYWYELRRDPQVQWVRHVVSYNEGIGSGMNIPAVDMDSDGDVDLVVTGKFGGPVWFENLLR